MAYIRENHYHIKGTPMEDEVFKTCTDNYVVAVLGYDKGKGYYWRISREGRYTLRSEGFDDVVMRAFSLGDRAPSLYEILVPCNRAGKTRQRQAEELFDINVVNAIKHRLGYEIEFL